MKVLGALPSSFLTSIKKDFVRQMSDVYYANFNCSAPEPFRKITSLSFLPHLLQIHCDWKPIPIHLFFNKFQIDCHVNVSCNDVPVLWLLASCKNHYVLRPVCLQLFEHKIHVRQNLLVCLRNITTWNISGWRPPSQGCDLKMSVIRRHPKKGPVCLQETRWTTSMTIGMQQRFCAVQVCSSEAIET